MGNDHYVSNRPVGCCNNAGPRFPLDIWVLPAEFTALGIVFVELVPVQSSQAPGSAPQCSQRVVLVYDGFCLGDVHRWTKLCHPDLLVWAETRGAVSELRVDFPERDPSSAAEELHC